MEGSAASLVRKQVLASTNRFWRVEDFQGPPHAVVLELRRLLRAGELERVRRGVYWRGRKTRFGMAVPAAVEAVRKATGEREAVGAAGWYATNLLGLSTQVSPVPIVAISTRPPTGLRGVKLLDRSRRTGRRTGRLNYLEVTLLEALEGWDRHVELAPDAATRRFLELLRNQRVSVTKLARASKTEPPRVRERLRALLEAGGWETEARLIEPARSESARSRALHVMRPSGG